MSFNVDLKNLFANLRTANALNGSNLGKEKVETQKNAETENKNYRLANELDPNDLYGGLISFSAQKGDVSEDTEPQINLYTTNTTPISTELKASSSNNDNIYLKDGVPFTGVENGLRYVRGRLYTGYFNGVEYKDGIKVETSQSTQEVDPDPKHDVEIIDYSEETEFGTMGYILGLLDLPLKIENTGADGSVNQNYVNIVKDENGRVVSFDYVSNQAVLNPLVNFKNSYEITYNENGQITVTLRHSSPLEEQENQAVTTTVFDEQKRPVSVTVTNGDDVQSISTYTYEDNVTTITKKDGEDNVIETKIITKNSDDTTSTKIEKLNGSWETTVTDSNGNFISKEGKVIFTNDGINNFTVDGVEIARIAGRPESEVTYLIDRNGEVTINASNVMISDESDNISYIVIKGDSNIIYGYQKNDNVKVIGNNNKVDLGDGVDNANIIGDNNSIKNTENLNMRSKDIPAGEIGSTEYVIKLLYGDGPLADMIRNLKTDDEGRIIKFGTYMEVVGTPSDPNSGFSAVKTAEYSVSYDNTGGITVMITMQDGSYVVTKTFDADGKLVSEKSVNQSTNPMKTVEKIYEDEITTEITTLGNPDKPLSVESKYKYKTEGYETVYKNEYQYYDNGNIKTSTLTYTKDDVQFEKTTYNYNEDGIMISETGEKTLTENGADFCNGLIIRNSSKDNVSYSYTMDKNGKLTINGDNLEIAPVRYYFGYNPRPIYLDGYATGTTVEVTSEEELNNLIDSNREVISEKVPLYMEFPINDVTVNGNRNNIRGSYDDDNMTVKGNHNTIDLAEGNDKLNVIGFNNTIKNVEEVTSKQIAPGEVG